MMPINPRALTIKIPRKPLTVLDRDHMLDIALACAFLGDHDPANYAERKEFERYIATSSKIKPNIKEVLANLTEEERSRLFC